MTDLPRPELFKARPTQEVLDTLEAAVRSLGGRALSATHRPKPIDYTTRPPGLGEERRWHPQPNEQTCGCRNETMMELPYEPMPLAGVAPMDAPDVEHQPRALVCAICDAAFLFPRLAS